MVVLGLWLWDGEGGCRGGACWMGWCLWEGEGLSVSVVLESCMEYQFWWSLAATGSLGVAREGGKAPLEIMEVVQGEHLVAISPTQRTHTQGVEEVEQSIQRFTTWRVNGKEHPAQPLFLRHKPFQILLGQNQGCLACL